MATLPHVPPLVALFAWIPVTLFLFYRYPVRIAVLVDFVAGWALLPTANFPPTGTPFPYWILGACLPAGYFVTKATITGLAAILGVLWFDRQDLRRFRLTAWDLPMILWCLAPLFSGVANAGYHQALWEGLRGTAYQALAWGAPYLLGRIYFSDNASLTLAAKAFAIAGLCYIPICMVEIYAGPQFYALLYGYQPYRWLGAERYVGFRPIGFLEDGNQLGIWMAAATLCSAGLAKQGKVPRLLGLRIGLVTVLLLYTTILCQSAGSIIILICLLPLVLVSGLSGLNFRRGLVVACAGLVICFAALRLINVISLRQLVDRGGIAHSAASFFARIGRQSFGWRLEQDERHVRTALAMPLLGSGEWDWWKNGEGRPWGLWLLAFGMYGSVGLLALEAMQLLPVIGAAWFTPEPDNRRDIRVSLGWKPWARDSGLQLGLAAAVLLAALDNLLNGDMILPLVLVIGGMSVWKVDQLSRRLYPRATIVSQRGASHPTGSRSGPRGAVPPL